MHGEMVQQEISTQYPVLSGSGLLGTEYWHPTTSNCYAVRKCGELLAGLPDSCCWSCSPRPSGRWRWPVRPSRKPCTDCVSRCPTLRSKLQVDVIQPFH